MRRLRLVTLLLLVCAGMPAWSPVAYARTALENASPGPGDTVAAGVDLVSLTFDGLKPGTTPKVVLRGPDQAAVLIGTPVVERNRVVCVRVTPLREGAHTLTYTVVGAGNDVRTGTISFTTAIGAKPAAASTACDAASLPAPASLDRTLPGGLNSPHTVRYILGGVVGVGIVAVAGAAMARRRAGPGRRRGTARR
jgi:methionine-rich copper-binding protein CopC